MHKQRLNVVRILNDTEVVIALHNKVTAEVFNSAFPYILKIYDSACSYQKSLQFSIFKFSVLNSAFSDPESLQLSVLKSRMSSIQYRVFLNSK